MPYVICSDCRVTTYSAALWSSTDECPSCGVPLPVRQRPPVVPVIALPVGRGSTHPPRGTTDSPRPRAR